MGFRVLWVCWADRERVELFKICFFFALDPADNLHPGKAKISIIIRREVGRKTGKKYALAGA